VRRDQELPLCQTELVPASSRMDLPLAKFEAISNTGSASVITYRRKAKKLCTAATKEKSEERM